MKPLLILKTYAWILDTLRDYGPISLKDIQRLWENERLSEENSMVRQTFIRYKNDMEEFFNIKIGYDKHYRYYIDSDNALHKDSVQNWMLSSLEVNTALAENKEVYDRILIEYIPSAGRFLRQIVEAMKDNTVIDIEYQRYEKTTIRKHTLEPYFVKLYHQRWYLLGRKKDGAIMTFALDRIRSLSKTKKKFRVDKRINANDYFSECFGVMKDETKRAERIVLRAYGTEMNYLRDLKLHHSQKEIATGDDFSDFELYLRPSMDFRGKLLERGDRLMVMEPQHLAEEVMAIHQESVKRYKRREDFMKV